MLRKIFLAALVAALAAGGSACTVMQSTYQKKAEEAESLRKRYDALQNRYEKLLAENAGLKERNAKLAADLEEMARKRDKLTTDLAYVTGQRDKLASDREELDRILQSKSDSLSQTIYELRHRIASLEEENGDLKRRQAALEKAKQEQVEKVSSTYRNLLEKMRTEIAQGQVTISELKGRLTVNMVDSILFDSGRAEVKKAGIEVLKKVVSILADVKDKEIRVEGFTDNVPITGALAKKYPTNWELSAARAINVTRYLQERGIDPSRLSAVAYGEYNPVGDNATPEGRAKNRRIEIVLAPRE